MIIPATINDIPAIQHVVKMTWPVTYGNILPGAQINYMLKKFYATESLVAQMNNSHQFYLLKEGAETVGFIDIEKTEETKTRLHKIYLLPGQQGKNYGKALIAFAVDKARESNAGTLQLNVNRYNKALGFYKKMGFCIVDEVDIPIGKGYFMNDYVMEKTI